MDAARDDACLDDATVLALLEGRLTGEALSRADEHLDRCEICSSLVVGVARGGAREVIPPQGARIGRYVVIEEIGRGGFGAVLCAYDPQLDRRVALKLLLVPSDPTWSARLGDEARAMAKLNHPHVVTVYEVGTQGDTVFIAMELVEGETLRQWLEGQRTNEAITEVFGQAGEGLAAAHEAGLVHGDFKPDNVLIGHDGRVRVTDFGLARSEGWGADVDDEALEGLAVDRSTTVTGRLVGTPAYMAPEQLAGGAANASSDQHAFCVSLYEALAGRRPFEAPSLERLVEDAAERRAPPLEGVRKRLAELVARGLAADPEDRFEDMRSLLANLRDDASGRRRRWLVGGLAAAATAVLGVAIAAQPPPCSGGEALADETWNPDRRTALLVAFDRAQPGSAVGADRTVAAAVDDWRSRWLASYRGICLASRDAPSSDDDARRGCLQRQRLEVAALIAAFQTPSRQAVARAPEVFAGLPDPAVCETVATAAPTGEQAKALVGFHEALVRAKAELAVGHFERARALAGELTKQSAEAAYEPARAEAELLLGESQWRLGKLDSAEEATLEALWASRRASDDRLAALSWLQRAAIAGTGEQLDDADEAIGHAAALLPKLADPRLAARLHNARGVLLTHLHRFDEAGRELELGLQLRRERLGPSHVEVARSLTSLGNLARKRGDLAEARRYHEAAQAIDRELLGEEHPNQARHLHNLARVTLLEGDPDEARALYERALALRREALGDDHPDVGVTYNSLGLLHARAGRRDEARHAFDNAIERLSATRPVSAERARANLASLDEPKPAPPPPALSPVAEPSKPPSVAPAPKPPPPKPPPPKPPPPKPPPPKPPPPKPPPPKPPPPPSSYMPGEAWD